MSRLKKDDTAQPVEAAATADAATDQVDAADGATCALFRRLVRDGTDADLAHRKDLAVAFGQEMLGVLISKELEIGAILSAVAAIGPTCVALVSKIEHLPFDEMMKVFRYMVDLAAGATPGAERKFPYVPHR